MYVCPRITEAHRIFAFVTAHVCAALIPSDRPLQISGSDKEDCLPAEKRSKKRKLSVQQLAKVPLSEYEKRREQNIERNRLVMASIFGPEDAVNNVIAQAGAKRKTNRSEDEGEEGRSASSFLHSFIFQTRARRDARGVETRGRHAHRADDRRRGARGTRGTGVGRDAVLEESGERHVAHRWHRWKWE